MNLVPQNIQRQFDDLYDMFNSAFSRNVSTVNKHGNDFWAPFTSFEPFGTIPHVDVEETDSEVKVRAEIPGLNKDEIHLDLNQDRLTIRGEKKQESEDNGRNYYRRECSYGSFSRNILLPAKVDDSKAEAEYKNGVLTIHLPKTEEFRKKPIEIKVAS